MFALLHKRGERRLKDTLATKSIVGWVLSRDAGLTYPQAVGEIKTEQELRAFLKPPRECTLRISESDKEKIRAKLYETFHGKYTIEPYSKYEDFEFFFEDRIKKKGFFEAFDLLIPLVEELAKGSEEAGFNIDI